MPLVWNPDPIPEKYRGVFGVSVGHGERLLAYPYDEQLTIYLLGVSKFHPPLNYSIDIASQGRAVVPTIIARLKEEQRDWARAALISLLAWIARVQDLRDEPDVIETVRLAIDSMSSSLTGLYWKRDAEASLKIISKTPAQNREDALRSYLEVLRVPRARDPSCDLRCLGGLVCDSEKARGIPARQWCKAAPSRSDP